MKTRNKKDDLEEEKLIENLHSTIVEVVSLAVKQSLDIREALFTLNNFYRSRRKNLEAIAHIVKTQEGTHEEAVKVSVTIPRKKKEKKNSGERVRSFQKVASRKKWHPDETDEKFLRSLNISPN